MTELLTAEEYRHKVAHKLQAERGKWALLTELIHEELSRILVFNSEAGHQDMTLCVREMIEDVVETVDGLQVSDLILITYSDMVSSNLRELGYKVTESSGDCDSWQLHVSCGPVKLEIDHD